MKVLDDVPKGLDEIMDYYGNPDMNDDFAPDVEWQQENLVWVAAPYDLFLPWRLQKPCKHIYCHKKIVDALVDALKEIMNYRDINDTIIISGKPFPNDDYLVTKRLNRYGGCYYFRKMHSYDALSTHSWGIAIDLNPDVACYGCLPKMQPDFIVKAFQKRGFDWGGAWGEKYTSDPMHAQACVSY